MRLVLFAWILKRPIAWISMLFIALSLLCNIVVVSVSEGMLQSFVTNATTGCPDFIMTHRPDAFSQNSPRYDQEYFEEAIAHVEKSFTRNGNKMVFSLKQLETIGMASLPGEKNSSREPVQLRGVDETNFLRLYQYKADNAINYHRQMFEKGGEHIPTILGSNVARNLGLFQGEVLEVTFIAPFRLGDHLKKDEVKTVKLVVVEVARFYPMINNAIFISLENMQELMNRSGESAMLSSVYFKYPVNPEPYVTMENFYPLETKLNEKLAEQFHGEYGLFVGRSWFRNVSWLWQNIKEIRMVQIIVFFVIILGCAATYLMIHLLMREKVQTIGLLMAMGMSTPRVFLLVISFGFLLSFFGVLLGSLAGHFFMSNIEDISQALLGYSDLFAGYDMPGLPHVDYFVFLGFKIPITAGLGTTFVLLSTISALFPAIIASRINPSQVLTSQ